MMTNTIALDQLVESRLNPRKDFDEEKLAELTASVREHGVLQPILVRPHAGKNGATHEIVAGHRRFRAAKAAGLSEIPAVVREIADDVMLELMLTENLRRADLHPMEEAAGYEVLHRKHKRSVDDIAAKVGKSASYVYDRMKLCALCEEAQTAFLAGKFAAGHAILLARLKPEQQARAMDPAERALFEHEYVLFDPDQERDEEHDRIKARSVREFGAWIDEHIRFDAAAVDQMVFPETAAKVAEAEKVLPITREFSLPTDLKGEVRTLTCRSWKRADGEAKSKTCEHAEMGLIVVGHGRGEAFLVCTKKDRCKTHWGAEMREKAKRAKEREEGSTGKQSKAQAKWEREEARRKAEQEKREAEQKRYKKALPAIREAFVARIKELEPKASGPLGQILLKLAYGYGTNPKKLQAVIPAGPNTEDLLRHLVFVQINDDLSNDWIACREAPDRAKTLGIDLEAILDEHAPAEKPVKKGKGVHSSGDDAEPGTCRQCGCSEEAACEGGCAWADETETLCTACAPAAPRKRKAAKRKGKSKRASSPKE